MDQQMDIWLPWDEWMSEGMFLVIITPHEEQKQRTKELADDEHILRNRHSSVVGG